MSGPIRLINRMRTIHLLEPSKTYVMKSQLTAVAGRGFAKRADVDASIYYAIKALDTWFARDKCRGRVNKNLSDFWSLPGRRWSWDSYHCRYTLVPDNNRSYARSTR